MILSELSEAKVGDLVRLLPIGNPNNYITAKLVEKSEQYGKMEYWFITEYSLTNRNLRTNTKKKWRHRPGESAMFDYEIYTEELHPEYFL